MKLKTIYASAALVAGSLILMSKSGGPIATNTGDLVFVGGPFSSNNCEMCHTAGSPFDLTADVDFFDAQGQEVSSYIPGETYRIVATIFDLAPMPSGYGLQFGIIADNGGTDVGSFSNVPSGFQSHTVGDGIFVEHTATLNGGFSTSLEVDWTAPTAGAGEMVLGLCGLGVNGDGGTSGDEMANDFIIITEDTSSTINVTEVEALQEAINIYPNPAVDVVNIDTKDLVDAAQVSIYSIEGSLVYQSNLASNITAIDVANYSNGAYQIVLTNESNTVLATRMFMKK